MELKAAIEALSALKEPCRVTLYSDSSYLIDAFTKGWIEIWKRNGWMTSSREQVKNIELWKELDRLSGIHDITWVKVKGHADNEYNNRCDKLAVLQIKNFKKEQA